MQLNTPIPASLDKVKEGQSRIGIASRVIHEAGFVSGIEYMADAPGLVLALDWKNHTGILFNVPSLVLAYKKNVGWLVPKEHKEIADLKVQEYSFMHTEYFTKNEMESKLKQIRKNKLSSVFHIEEHVIDFDVEYSAVIVKQGNSLGAAIRYSWESDQHFINRLADMNDARRREFPEHCFNQQNAVEFREVKRDSSKDLIDLWVKGINQKIEYKTRILLGY